MDRRSSRAGGFFIALGATTGLLWGAATGRATLGVLVGTAVGIAAMVVLWLRDLGRPT